MNIRTMWMSCLTAAILAVPSLAADATQPTPEVLTPAAPHTPRINGARVYGERPGVPFLFTIPATGDEPMTYAADPLPDGLMLDSKTGRITGSVGKAGSFKVKLTATNSMGADSKPLRIEIGDKIALTPPMGWNSWNCFAGAVDQGKVAAAAHVMIDKGLLKHGWTYINIDDTWQGDRLPDGDHAMQANSKFPDMKGLCDEIHGLGLKAGIYSTPWVTSYANYRGSSGDTPEGTWSGKDPKQRGNAGHRSGTTHFYKADAKQWGQWGFDYLKYDWNPNTPAETSEMSDALQASGRDFIYSLSNGAPFDHATDWTKLANAWRTTGDINDSWNSMVANGFSQDRWVPFGGPGHWNDPDMLVVGYVGWGPKLHPTKLTADEQYTHMTLWSLLASPLLIGCDMTKLDDFTLGLLTNDEVLAIDQDEMGKQASRISEDKSAGTEIWARPLADGTMAVGLFNRGRYSLAAPSNRRNTTTTKPTWRLLDRSNNQSQTFASEAEATAAMPASSALPVTVRWSDLKLNGSQPVRDLWRQTDMQAATDQVVATVPFHGAVLLKIGAPTSH